ncbi:SgcJ/EcaC family oxidoreductase [Gramella sp. KN1008]|uniref:YybH family protein n=1 Tax=Gramella sp. KN1008 TaxID=2529298 RepID=UPI0013F14547|nr:SgcJ/EcaC family oxidoreductase [Gramella sp. KN1008]
MRTVNLRRIISFFLIIIVWQFSHAQQAEIEKEILAITEKYNQAWESLDIEEISKYHADDILYYWYGSQGPTSKKDFDRLLEQMLPSMTEYIHEILSYQVQVLSDNVVTFSHMYDGQYTATDGKTTNYDGALTYVFKKMDEEWKIVLIHESARNEQ